MFKQASQMKLRFGTTTGQITTEDLWDLPLTSKSKVSLDGIAISVNKMLKESEGESFVEDQPTGNSILQLKLDILKEVIAVRKAINEANRLAITKSQKKSRIAEIIAGKQDQELADKSLEELEALLAAE